jgi:hypothetical protein
MTPAPWFAALGTARKNAIKNLHKEIVRFRDDSRVYFDKEKYPLLFDIELRRVEKWKKDIRTVEIASAIDDADLEIKHGPFTVIPIPGVPKAYVDQALEALDAAADKIRPKFPQVLYGKVFLGTSLGKGIAAHYVESLDQVQLNVAARKRFDNVYTIIHEFGHRFDAKFFKNAELRNEFNRLSTVKEYEVIHYDAKLRKQCADEVVSIATARLLGKPVPKMSSVLEAWLKSPNGPTNIRKVMQDFLNYIVDEKKVHAEAMGSKDVDVMTDKVLHEPLQVTPYGGKNVTENFAEAFAHYVLGMKMQPEFVTILEKLSK